MVALKGVVCGIAVDADLVEDLLDFLGYPSHTGYHHTGNSGPQLTLLIIFGRCRRLDSICPSNVHTISERVDCIDQRLPRRNQHDLSHFVPLGIGI